MKKLLSVLLTVALIVSFSVPVYAAPNTQIHLKPGAESIPEGAIVRAVIDISSTYVDGVSPFDPYIVNIADVTNEDTQEGIIEYIDGTMKVNVFATNSPQYVSSDFSQDVTPYVETFEINGIVHQVNTGKDSPDVGAGNEGGGTINFWLNNLIELHEVTVALTPESPSGSATWTGNNTYYSGDDVDLTFTAEYGYEITNVTKDGTSIPDFSQDSITDIQSDVAYLVTTEKVDFTLTTTYKDDGVVISGPEMDYIPYLDSFTKNFTAPEGYTIEGVYVEGSATSELNLSKYDILSMEADVNIVVELEMITYDLTISYTYPDATPDSMPVDYTYDYGEDVGTVLFDDFDELLYKISNVTLNGGNIGNGPSDDVGNIFADHHYIVTLIDIEVEPITFDITINGDGGADYDGQGTYVQYLDVTPTFWALDGYRLDKVTVSVDGGTAADLSITNPYAVLSDPIDDIDNDYHYEVTTIKELTVEVIVTPTGKATPEGSWTVDEGDDLDLTFKPIEGYAIVEIIRVSVEMGEETILEEGVDDPILDEMVWDDVDSMFEDVTFYVKLVPLYEVEVVVMTPGTASYTADLEGIDLAGSGPYDYTFEALDHYDLDKVEVNGVALTDPSEFEIASLDQDYLIEIYTVPELYKIEIKSVPIETILEHGFEELDIVYNTDKGTVTFTPIEGWAISYVELNGFSEGDIDEYEIGLIDMDYEFIVHTYEIPAPGVMIDKASVVSESNLSPKGTWNIGETVTYLITVMNTGNVPLEYLIVEDLDLGITEEFFNLAAGSEVSFTVTTSYSSSGNKSNTAVVEAYEFYYDQEVVDEPLVDRDTANVSIREPFTPEKVTYTLELGSTEGGSFVGQEGIKTYNSGTVVALKWKTDEGYEFVGFSEDSNDEDLSDTNRITMNSNKKIFLIFEPIIEVIEEEDPIPEAPPVLDEEIPDAPIPETSGLPTFLFTALGTSFVGLGLKIKKQTK